MRRISLFTLDKPYREPLTIWGYGVRPPRRPEVRCHRRLHARERG